MFALPLKKNRTDTDDRLTDCRPNLTSREVCSGSYSCEGQVYGPDSDTRSISDKCHYRIDWTQGAI